MTRIKYQVIDRNGKVHKRTTTHREYQFAVVTHYPERPDKLRPNEPFPAHSSAEWCGRRDLAENVKRRSERSGYEAEILEAVRS
jgi:hypothetical protein